MLVVCRMGAMVAFYDCALSLKGKGTKTKDWYGGSIVTAVAWCCTGYRTTCTPS